MAAKTPQAIMRGDPVSPSHQPVPLEMEEWMEEQEANISAVSTDNRSALAEIGTRCATGEAVKIAAYGDSTVLGNDSVESYNNWPNRLASILGVITGNGSVAVYNVGTGGKKIIDGWAAANFDAQIEDDPTNTAAQYVLICFGLNDIKDDGSPGWDADLYKTKYGELIAQVRASGRVPVVVSSWIISAAAIRPVTLIQSDLLNEQREVASENRVAFLDTNAMLAQWWRDRNSSGNRFPEVQPDGTHYKDAPHIVIAQFMAREIFAHRIVDVKHGSRVGVHNYSYASTVSVAYDDEVNNFFGVAPLVTASGTENTALDAWVWSDRERKVVYVSVDRDKGSAAATAVFTPAGTPDTQSVAVDVGAAAVQATDRPSEVHIEVGTIPYGMTRLRYKMDVAGTNPVGYFLIIDDYEPVSISAYTVATVDELFLPEKWFASPNVIAKQASDRFSILVNGSIPVGWGVVLSTQYLFHDASDTSPLRRAESIVALRTSGGADIRRVRHGASGIFANESIATSATGALTGQISIHAQKSAGNVNVQVRADGQTIATYDTAGTGDFYSPYGHMGGLFRDQSAVADPAGRQAHVTLIPHAGPFASA